jgi:hypothetical protein
MLNYRILVAVSLVGAACGSESGRLTPQTSTCGVTDSTRLSGNGVGALRVGATVDSVRAVCQVVRDTTLEFGNEGQPERRVAVLVSADTVETAVEGGKVWRIEVITPSIQTTDSLGVGTTAASLRAKGATLAVGDRGVFALVPSHCGLSFHLGGVDPAHGRSWTGIADSVRVDMVLVFGCGMRPA